MSPVEVSARCAMDAMRVVMSEHQRELDRAHAENLALRAVLSEHGITVPAPDGVVTLERLRALENVLDLARHHLRGDVSAGDLSRAIHDAGRMP